jgi:gliding motility-associated-like protein
MHEVHPSHGYSATGGTTNVTLIALNGNGCHDTVTLELNFLVIPENGTVLLFMPNTFTTDGNEYNQYFFPVFNESLDITAYEMKVYNRWGEVIFNSKDTQIVWDGSFKNFELQSGTYTWVVQFRDKHTFKRYKHEGHVNLLR